MTKAWKNPYDSPRVIRVLFEEVIESVEAEFAFKSTEGPFPEARQEGIHFIQTAIDARLHRVEYRGVKIWKVIDLQAKLTPDQQVIFVFRPLSEDGRWLLKQMALDIPLPELRDIQTAKAHKVKVRRVIEL